MKSSRAQQYIIGSVAGAAMALLVPACVADVQEDTQPEHVGSAEQELHGVGDPCGGLFGPCDQGLTCCSDGVHTPKCRDLMNDRYNCGSCNHNCDDEGKNYCAGGVCYLIGE